MIAQLKGQVVSAGVRALTGLDMPIHEKRRFQHGAGSSESKDRLLARTEARFSPGTALSSAESKATPSAR